MLRLSVRSALSVVALGIGFACSADNTSEPRNDTNSVGGSSGTGGSEASGGTAEVGGSQSGGSASGGSATGGQNGGTGGSSTDAGPSVGGSTGTGGRVITDGGTCSPLNHAVSAGWTPKPASCGPACMRVRNFCPFPMYVHTGIKPDTGVPPDDQKVDTGKGIDVPTPTSWPSKRVSVFKDGPQKGELQFVEMHFANGSMNYNVTYVDYAGLPVEVTGVGTGCVASQHTTGCYLPYQDFNASCPDAVLKEGTKCMAPRTYCMNQANQSNELCHRLDAKITECNQKNLGCPPLTTAGTPAVYGCNSGTFYGANTLICAALNRGMLDAPTDKNRNNFFQKPPFNSYVAWVQCQCPHIYAFSYDDVHEQGGFKSCKGDELRITFCPGDVK